MSQVTTLPVREVEWPSPNDAPLDGALPGGGPAATPWFLLLVPGLLLLGYGLVGLNGTVAGVGILVQTVYLAYLVRHLAITAVASRYAAADVLAPVVDTGFRPSVTAIVACKNEESVARELMVSLGGLLYPEWLLQVIVVDDGSTDATGMILDALADSRTTVLHRAPGSAGGKSAALNAALAVATGEIVIVFDADHRPRPDVVRRLVRHFESPGVAAVQGRCVIRNPADSLIASLVNIDYMAGYLVNEYGRQGMAGMPAYGGANCAVRAETLRDIGGWNVNSVTEDTDLTLRLVLMGRRVRYDVTAVDEEEAVTTFSRFWAQRYRWARGHQQVWRDYRGAVWRSPHLSLGEKVETTMFLLAFHLPVLSAAGIAVLGFWLAGVLPPVNPADMYVLATLMFLAPMVELGTGMLLGGLERRQAVLIAAYLPVFVASAALCATAWVDGLLGRPYSWAKTKRRLDAETISPGRPVAAVHWRQQDLAGHTKGAVS